MDVRTPNWRRNALAWLPAALAGTMLSGFAGQALAQATPVPASRERVTAGPGIQLEADLLTTDAAGISVEATGNVIARNEGRTISASRLTYNRQTGVVEAFGNVTIVEPGGAATFAQSVTVEDNLASGIIRSFSIRFPNGAVLASDAAIRQDGNRNLLSRVIYTACPVCADGTPPTWAIRAERAVQDQSSASISYSNVVLEVAGTPVAYVPVFAHPDPSANRQSGFLPTFPASDSRLGMNVELPYLLVLDPHSDLTITPLISANVNPVLNLGYRRAFHSGSLMLEGSGTHEALFGDAGRRIGEADFRGHLFGTGRFDINRTWTWGFGVETATDDTYILRYGVRGAGMERGPVRTQSGRLVSQLYLEGQTPAMFARVTGVAVQDLIGGERRRQTPDVLPQLEWDWRPATTIAGGQARLFANAVALDRNTGLTDSARVSAGASWERTLVTSGGLVVRPQAQARVDAFSYQPASGVRAPDSSFTRAVAAAGVDVSWPLQRATGTATWEIEPRLSLVVASDATRQGDVLVEDSRGFGLDRYAMFALDGVAGFDAWQEGPRATLGVAAGGRFASGLRLDSFVGVQVRDGANRAFDRSSNLDRSSSDVIAQAGASFRDSVSVRTEIRFDPELSKVVRTEAWANARLGRFDFTGRYHESAPEAFGPDFANREFQGTLRIAITKNWQVFGATIYDVRNENALLGRLGLIFQDECTELRMFYQRSGVRNRFIEPSDGFRIQVALKTFGALTSGLDEIRW